MTFYLGSPNSQMHADWCRGMPVLVSFALYARWMDDYVSSFGRVLVDSGAFTEFNSGKTVDGEAYRDWQARWKDVAHIDAIAGLDDIRGDWRKSLANYEKYGGFPTMHETDPPELLADLIPIARERGNWLGVGLLPPRTGKWAWVRSVLAQVPDDLHVHVWAGGEYCGHPRVNSADSVNWFKEAFSIKTARLTAHLTPAECVEIMVKRYQRAERRPVAKDAEVAVGLFD